MLPVLHPYFHSAPPPPKGYKWNKLARGGHIATLKGGRKGETGKSLVYHFLYWRFTRRWSESYWQHITAWQANSLVIIKQHLLEWYRLSCQLLFLAGRCDSLVRQKNSATCLGDCRSVSRDLVSQWSGHNNNNNKLAPSLKVCNALTLLRIPLVFQCRLVFCLNFIWVHTGTDLLQCCSKLSKIQNTGLSSLPSVT